MSSTAVLGRVAHVRPEVIVRVELPDKQRTSLSVDGDTDAATLCADGKTNALVVVV